MRIGILGPLAVWDDVSRPVEVSGQRLRALLIRLAVDAGRAVSADQLINDLWEEAGPAAPGPALHSLVSRLRGVGGRYLAESAPGGYRMGVDPGEIDAVVFERLVAAARGEQRTWDRAATLRRALDLWRGPALSDVADAAFAAATIARLEELRLAATEERIDADLELHAAGCPGDAARLVAELEGLTTAHPLRERLRGQLMRALYAAGQQAAALEVYEDTRRQLADRLGADPSAELAALHLAILRRDGPFSAGSRTDAPAGSDQARGQRQTNLPAQLTTFVGREDESGRLRSLLEESRLVTLTGSGGAGKTRLASEVTGQLLRSYADGIWFVPLAPVSAPQDLPQAVLVAMGVADAVRVGDALIVVQPMERLVDALANRRLLLVLDNCEHLITAVARLADRVLAEASGVRILATSREPLGITGETLCPVPSLPLPPPGASADQARAYASVRLFADRAAAVRPGFMVDAGTAELVVGICRRLDGIPLAIELAAARLRSLTLAQIAGRLDDRFRLLDAGSRVALPRHQTLRAVVDWSWDLLDGAERAVLRQLSVFNGGATPDSAERVCASGDGRQVIDVVAALIDKSLVMATGDGIGSGEVRYRLLETVQAYADERLAEAGERDPSRAAHAAYFLDLAERAEPQLRRRDQLRWSERLTAERDNLSAALQYAIDIRDVRTALRLVGALAWFWVTCGYESEAGSWAVAVREIADNTPPPGLEDAYAICTFMAALVVEMTDDPGPSPESVSRALNAALSRMPDEPRHPVLSLAEPVAALFAGDRTSAGHGFAALIGHPDPWVQAITRVCLGYLALSEGRLDESAAELAAGYAGFQAIGERWGMVVALGNLTELALIRGDATEAVRLGEEAYRYAAEGVDQAQGALLVTLGRARAEAGDVPRARTEIEQGVGVLERLGEYADAADGHLALSELARREGDLTAARAPLERARDLVEPRAARADFVQSAALTFSRLGCLAEQEGDLASAAEWHAKALGTVRDRVPEHNQVLATVIDGLAALVAARGENTRAAELLGGARTLRGYYDERSLEVRRVTAVAVDVLGREAFERAYERGRRETRDRSLAATPTGPAPAGHLGAAGTRR